ncbi:MAG: HNH endonuclease [Candidatus Micrarchaeia archaeon]
MPLITQSYIFTSDELQLTTNIVDGGDWSKTAFKTIKEKIKNHLMTEQNGTCPYCRLRISQATSYLPIEHIVPKTKHPVFMFEPKNLAVACEVCNTEKGDAEVLVDPLVTIYPTSGQHFLIIHPHFDNYDEHICVDDIFLKPITKKGEKTIKICNLCRPKVAEENARDKQIIKQSHIHSLSLRLAKENDPNIQKQILDFL